MEEFVRELISQFYKRIWRGFVFQHRNRFGWINFKQNIKSKCETTYIYFICRLFLILCCCQANKVKLKMSKQLCRQDDTIWQKPLFQLRCSFNEKSFHSGWVTLIWYLNTYFSWWIGNTLAFIAICPMFLFGRNWVVMV